MTKINVLLFAPRRPRSPKSHCKYKLPPSVKSRSVLRKVYVLRSDGAAARRGLRSDWGRLSNVYVTQKHTPRAIRIEPLGLDALSLPGGSLLGVELRGDLPRGGRDAELNRRAAETVRDRQQELQGLANKPKQLALRQRLRHRSGHNARGQIYKTALFDFFGV